MRDIFKAQDLRSVTPRVLPQKSHQNSQDQVGKFGSNLGSHPSFEKGIVIQNNQHANEILGYNLLIFWKWLCLNDKIPNINTGKFEKVMG